MKAGIIPERRFLRISDIEHRRDLLDEGYKLVLLDVDGTLRNRITRTVPEDILQWVRQCRKSGLFVCLVTNNRRDRHSDLADDLELPLLASARKPTTTSFDFALEEFGVTPDEAVVIGNNPLTDILGAHRARIAAYLVRPVETTKAR